MFAIRFSEVAERHLQGLTARHRSIVLDAISKQLQHEPLEKTRNRKELRPNPMGAWELRVQDFRVLYNVDVDQGKVYVVAIAVKKGNKFIVDGQEHLL